MKRFGFLAALGAVAAAPALPVSTIAAAAKSTTPRMLVCAPGMAEIAKQVIESPLRPYYISKPPVWYVVRNFNNGTTEVVLRPPEKNYAD